MQINPTILTNDAQSYIEQLSRDAKFAREIDIDVIDWQKTSSKTLSAQQSLDNSVDVVLNFDLMMDYPSEAIDLIVLDSRVKRIIINILSKEDIFPLLAKIKANNKLCGISFSEPEEYELIKEYFSEVDSVHFFTIQPGAQGNPFREEMLDFAHRLKEDGFAGDIGIDGGVNIDTLPTICKYPVDIAVVGSAVAKSQNPELTYLELVDLAQTLLPK
jgi:ribulose-phosphate 3-epimerase